MPLLNYPSNEDLHCRLYLLICYRVDRIFVLSLYNPERGLDVVYELFSLGFAHKLLFRVCSFI